MGKSSWLGVSLALVLVAVGAATAVADGTPSSDPSSPQLPPTKDGLTVEFVPATPSTSTTALYMKPFPVVRVAGSSVKGGTYISVLSVSGPRTTRVQVTCSGSGCPVGRLSMGPGRVRQLERFLRAGVTITVRATRPGYIGKYVRLVIRSHAAPIRSDACLLPGRTQPASCPT